MNASSLDCSVRDKRYIIGHLELSIKLSGMVHTRVEVCRIDLEMSGLVE